MLIREIRNRTKVLLFLLIVMTLFFSMEFVFAEITENLTFNFYDNKLLDVSRKTVPAMYNLDTIESKTKNYPAYASFEQNKEKEGISYYNPPGSTIEWKESYKGHDGIVYILDNSNDDYPYIQFNQDSNTKGFFTFWFVYFNDSGSADIKFSFFSDNSDTGVYLRLNTGGLEANEGTGFSDITEKLINGTWYNFAIDFNYITHTYDFFLNYVYVDTLDFFKKTGSYLDYMKIHTLNNYVGADFYVDGVDYSWSFGYYYKRNFEPTTEKGEGYQRDSYQFNYESTDFEANATQFKQIYDNIEGENLAYVVSDNDINSKLVIEQKPLDSSAVFNGVEWYPALESNITRIKIQFQIDNIDSGFLTFAFFPYNSDNSDFIYFSINNVDYNDIRFTVHDTRKNLNIDIFTLNASHLFSHLYTASIEFNSYDNYYAVEVLDENSGNYGSYRGIYDNSLMDNSYGMERIFIYTYSSNLFDYEATYHIYSIGAYENGISSFPNTNLDEFGMMYYSFKDWNTNEFNLISFEVNYSHEILIYPLDFTLPFTLVHFPSYRYAKTINLREKVIIPSGFIAIKVFDNIVELPILKIHGVGIEYNDIHEYPSYTYNDVNASNYFFVEGGLLKWNFSNSLSGNAESMSLELEFAELYIENYSIRYTSFISKYTGKIALRNTLKQVEYFDVASENSITTESIDDLNATTIDTLRIALSYTDDSESGYAEGFISRIQIAIPSQFIGFDEIEPLELNFLDGMIYVALRVLMFMLPVGVLFVVVGSKSVLPSWIIMLLIYFIASVIPFWILVIQSIAILLMVISNRNKNEMIE